MENSVTTYDRFADLLHDFVCELLRERAYTCELWECKLLSLSRFLQLLRILLWDTCLLCQHTSRIELGHSNLTYRAVTNKIAHAENICDNRLIVRLPKHEGDELADRREDHHYVALDFLLITKSSLSRLIRSSYETLCRMLSNVHLVGHCHTLFLRCWEMESHFASYDTTLRLLKTFEERPCASQI